MTKGIIKLNCFSPAPNDSQQNKIKLKIKRLKERNERKKWFFFSECQKAERK